MRARLATLTPEERQVMRLMLAGKTNKMIAQELDFGLRTIELRRANIMRKMEADTFADLVRLILLAGDQENPVDAVSDTPVRPDPSPRELSPVRAKPARPIGRLVPARPFHVDR